MTLSSYIRSLDRNHPVLYPPYAAERLGLTMPQFTDHVCALFDQWPRMRVIDNMLHLNPSPVECYYEVCDTKYRRGRVVPAADLWSWCLSNRKVDQHISVFGHDKAWVSAVKQSGKVRSAPGSHISIQNLWLELDRKVAPPGETPLSKAKADAFLFHHGFPFPDSVRIYTSGNNSVHILVDGSLFGTPIGPVRDYAGRGRLAYNLAHRIIGDIRYDNGLVDVWNAPHKVVAEAYFDVYREPPPKDKMKQIMENIDPNIYHANSLIRAPWSLHEKTGKPKAELDVPLVDELRRPQAPDFPPTPPYLLHLTFACLEPTYKRQVSGPAPQEDEVVSVFRSILPDFDPEDADHQGWVRELENPFYEDTNPALCVNIRTGQFHDFGDPDWQISFSELKKRIDNAS